MSSLWMNSIRFLCVNMQVSRPYVHVRFGINALIQRQSFYHLVNYGTLSENSQGEAVLTLKSGDLVLHLST